jgi:hypothetical protein
MSIVAVLLTKNETDLIEDFLEYYGRLLGGREHVVVVDNGSDKSNVRVQDAYATHISRGGRVIVDARSFRDANLFMTEHIQSLVSVSDENRRPQWILPLDTDEFMFDVNGPEHVDPVAVGRALRESLAAQSPSVGLVRYGKFLGSLVDPKDPGYEHGAYTRPAVQQTRFFDQGWDKLILRSSAFRCFSRVWGHHADMREGFRTETCGRLGLLHFHDTGLRRRVERARQVVYAYNYMRPEWTLEEQLQRARPFRDAPIANGHRLIELVEHLERKATLLAFKRYLGRLPRDVEELKKYSGRVSQMPADAVRQDMARGLLGCNADCQTSWDGLLYHEERGTAAAAEFTFRIILPNYTHTAYSALLEHLYSN